MTWQAWLAAAFAALLAGAFLLCALDDKVRGWDWLWVLTWPVSLPMFWVGRKVNRRLATCACGRYFGTAARRREHEALSARRGHHDNRTSVP